MTEVRRLLDLKVRQSRCAALMPRLRSDLAEILKAPEGAIAFADLERSDRVLAEFRNRWREARSKDGPLEWHLDLTAEAQFPVQEALEEVRSRLPQGPLLLFRAQSEWCGAVLLTLNEIVNHAFELLELDQEDIIATDEPGTCGLTIQFVTDGAPVGHYEVFAWLRRPEPEVDPARGA